MHTDCVHTDVINRVSISGLSSPWLAGYSYTLTCVVIADVPPESVKWEYSDKDYQLMIPKERLSGNHTNLNLHFNNLRTSQAGRYSCTSQVLGKDSVAEWNVTIQRESDKHT